MPSKPIERHKVEKQKVDKLFYAKEDAAFALSLSLTSINAMIADQRLRTRRFGRRVLIPAIDVITVAETILESHMLQGQSRSI